MLNHASACCRPRRPRPRFPPGLGADGGDGRNAGEVEEDEYQESQCRCLREVAACQQLAGEVHRFPRLRRAACRPCPPVPVLTCAPRFPQSGSRRLSVRKTIMAMLPSGSSRSGVFSPDPVTISVRCQHRGGCRLRRRNRARRDRYWGLWPGHPTVLPVQPQRTENRHSFARRPR